MISSSLSKGMDADEWSYNHFLIEQTTNSVQVPLSRLNCCFGSLWTHAKCCGGLWLLSAAPRPQEKREHKEWERDQSRKQIHILIGQGLCLLGHGNADWPIVCECCLVDKTLRLHKIDEPGHGQ